MTTTKAAQSTVKQSKAVDTATPDANAFGSVFKTVSTRNQQQVNSTNTTSKEALSEEVTASVLDGLENG